MTHERGIAKPLIFALFGLVVLGALCAMMFGGGGASAEADESAAALENAAAKTNAPDLHLTEANAAKTERKEEAAAEEPKKLDADPNAIPADATGVSGRVIGRDGKPAKNVEVVIERVVEKKLLAKYGLTAEPGKTSARFVKSGHTDEDGHFVVTDLIADPGYDLRARGDKGAMGRKDYFEVVDKVVIDIGDVPMRLGALIGGVVRDEGGAPIANADVNFEWSWNEKPYKTDAQGRFKTDVIMPGKHQIRVKAKGYAMRETMQREFLEGDQVDDLEIELVKAEPIRVRVVDETGRGLKDAYVNAYKQQDEMSFFGWFGDNGQTDANGEFVFDSIPAGTYQVSSNLMGFRGAQQENVKAGGAPVELQLKKQSYVEGTIIDAKTGEAVKGTSLRLLFVPPNQKNGNQTFRPYWRGSEANLDVVGKFSVTLNEGGYFKVEISADGYKPGESQPFQLAENAQMSGIAVRLEKGEEITILARDKVTKAPIQGAVVKASEYREPQNGNANSGNGLSFSVTGGAMRFYGEDFSFDGGNGRRQAGRVVTGAEGKAVMKTLYPGKFSAVGRKDGFADAKVESFEVKAGDTSTVVEVEFSHGGSIEGKVTNDRNVPEPALTVVAVSSDNQSREAVTDADGRYKIANLTPGHFKVSAQMENDGSDIDYGSYDNDGEEKPVEQRFPVLVEDGGTAKHDFSITRTPPGSITGTVTFNGAPAADVMVMVIKMNDQGNDFDWNTQSQSKTDAQGAFKFRSLKPGKYGVTTGKNWQKSYGAGQVQVASGQEASVLLDIPLGGIRGRVVDQNGQPIAGVNLWVNRNSKDEQFNPWGGGRSAQSDANGDFVFDELQVGEYSLNASARKYKAFDLASIAVPARRDAGPVEVKLVFGGWIQFKINGIERLGQYPRLRVSISNEKGEEVNQNMLWPDEKGEFWLDSNYAPKGTIKLTAHRSNQATTELGSTAFEIPAGGNLELSFNVP